jgi:hypothetical protein
MSHKTIGAIVLALFLMSAITIPVSAYQYSMTNVEWYDTISDLFPWGRDVCNVVSNWMGGSAGWSQRFYDRDGNVNDLDFGSQNSGYQGLDEAEFHYHFGHGDLVSGETYVDYSNYPTSSLTRGDV